MNNDFGDFINGSGPVPERLKTETQDVLLVSLRPKRTVLKFYSLQAIGMFLTLFICPQYGFYSDGSYIVEDFIMKYGSIFCGLLCGLVFFSGGFLLSSLFMKRSEMKWVIWHRYSVIIPFNLALFFIMISTKGIAEDYSHAYTATYDVMWFLSSFLVGVICLTVTQRLQKVRFAASER
jgi:uncharacterized integral membrane protein